MLINQISAVWLELDFQDFELLIAFLQIKALYKHVTINFYLVMVTYVIRHEDCQIQKSFIIYYWLILYNSYVPMVGSFKFIFKLLLVYYIWKRTPWSKDNTMGDIWAHFGAFCGIFISIYYSWLCYLGYNLQMWVCILYSLSFPIGCHCRLNLWNRNWQSFFSADTKLT